MRDGVIRAAVGLTAVVVISVAVGRLLRSHRPGAPGITIEWGHLAAGARQPRQARRVEPSAGG